MKIFRQLFTIFVLCMAGELISKILPFTFPASVLSMILLFVLLVLKIIKPERIKEVSEFLLGNMAFFFIPAGVGIIEKYSYIKKNLIVLFLICIITMVVTFAVTAFTVTQVIKLMNRKEQKENE